VSHALFWPALATIALGTGAGHVRWSLNPSTILKLLTAVAALAAMMAILFVGALAAGFAARSSVLFAVIGVCPVIPIHHQVGTVEGLAATLVLAGVGFRIQRVLQQRRWAVEGTQGRRILVLANDEPIAYAAPGKPGCVVVSRGLLDALEPQERQVLFAHERAHLDQRHHRYLLVGALSVAVIPMLRPLIAQVRLATERCADEAAALVMAGDRKLVATAITRAAVATSAYGGVVGSFGGASILARVEALIATPSTPTALTGAVVVVGVVSLGAVVGSVQAHHLFQLFAHLCGL